MEPGDFVIYTDGYRRDHNAIITAVWGPDCINVVFTTSDPTKTDSYGRQIERETSVSRYSGSNNYGRCFRDIGVDATFVDQPTAK